MVTQERANPNKRIHPKVDYSTSSCFAPVAPYRFLRSLVDYRVISGIETSYTAQALSRTIFASETPMRKKSPTFLECQACYCDTAKTVHSVRLPQLFRCCRQDAAS